MTYRVEVKVEAPADPAKSNSYRTTVFNVSMDTDLPLINVQLLATELLSKLTALATVGLTA